jgi:hypothetical protein
MLEGADARYPLKAAVCHRGLHREALAILFECIQVAPVMLVTLVGSEYTGK